MRLVTQIAGMSDKRRLPRIGKIRLGVKKTSESSGKEYPTETDYFVVPEEVAAVHGSTPKELDVMLPVENPDIVFPNAYEYYGSGSGLKCTGNGVVGHERDPNDGLWKTVACPCHLLEESKCAPRGHLSVILPAVTMGGVYQITTGSYNSIMDIHSAMDYVRSLVGRIAMVPLVLVRREIETVSDGKKRKHYPITLELRADLKQVNLLRGETNDRGLLTLGTDAREVDTPHTDPEILSADILIAIKNSSTPNEWNDAVTLLGQNQENLAPDLYDTLKEAAKEQRQKIESIALVPEEDDAFDEEASDQLESEPGPARTPRDPSFHDDDIPF